MSVGAIDFAIKADGLSASDKLVLILIANCVNDSEGYAYPSQRYLSERTGLTRETVNRVVARLEQAGFLIVTHQYRDNGGKRSSKYVIPYESKSHTHVTQDHKGSDAGSHTHVTQDHNIETVIKKRNLKQREANASRLSEDWKLPDEYAAWCKENRPDLDPRSVADSFRDYWISVPGSRATKRDWFAVWRNWVRKESKPGERKQSSASIPSWADLPRDDSKLADHARWHRLPDPKPGESFPMYRARLSSAVRERMRAD